MKILILHNHYLESGGEDAVVCAEKSLLERYGHKVILYERFNKDIERYNILKKIRLLWKDIFWSEDTYKDLKRLIRQEKPDIAHIHNIFLLLSPSVYDALKEEHIYVVQTLHNYRFICLNGLFFRNNHICEECLIKKNSFHSVIHRCWRNSFLLSLCLYRMLNAYSLKMAISKKIDAYIALSEFSKAKFVRWGLPANRIFIKPNFIVSEVKPNKNGKDYAVFVGRLVNYKGVDTVISAFQKIRYFGLKIIGSGPLLKRLQRMTKNSPNIELLGYLGHERTLEYIRESSFLIFPSICYENMPRVIVEAFSVGVAVIGSNIGATQELVRDGITGLLFNPADSDGLRQRIEYLIKNKDTLAKMRDNAYQEYQEKYTAEKNYSALIDIYKKVIA